MVVLGIYRVTDEQLDKAIVGVREEELRVVVETTEIVVDDVLAIEVVDVVRLVEHVDGTTDIVDVVWVVVEVVKL